MELRFFSASLILLFFGFSKTSCNTNQKLALINKNLQGKWESKDNNFEFLEFKKDSLLISNSEVSPVDVIRYTFKIDTVVTDKGDNVIRSRPNEYLLVYYQNGRYDSHDYLISFSDTEFTLMSGINLQTVSYKKSSQ